MFGFRYDAQDGLYDVAWSEIHENQLVTASGDGSIKMWDIMLNVCVLVFGLVAWFFVLKMVPRGSRTYLYEHGKNILEKSIPLTGITSRKIYSSRHHGMALSNWYVYTSLFSPSTPI